MSYYVDKMTIVCYYSNILIIDKIGRGAVIISKFPLCGEVRKLEGITAEVYIACQGIYAGPSENICRTVTDMWSAIVILH